AAASRARPRRTGRREGGRGRRPGRPGAAVPAVAGAVTADQVGTGDVRARPRREPESRPELAAAARTAPRLDPSPNRPCTSLGTPPRPPAADHLTVCNGLSDSG